MPRPDPPLLVLDDLALDTVARRAAWRGREAALSARECTLLHALMANADRVLSRGQLEQRLAARGRAIDSNAVEVHVHHLRRKLGRGLIETVRGVGYVLPRRAAAGAADPRAGAGE